MQFNSNSLIKNWCDTKYQNNVKITLNTLNTLKYLEEVKNLILLEMDAGICFPTGPEYIILKVVTTPTKQLVLTESLQ
jgi:hypothetical protein